MGERPRDHSRRLATPLRFGGVSRDRDALVGVDDETERVAAEAWVVVVNILTSRPRTASPLVDRARGATPSGGGDAERDRLCG